VEIRRQVGGRRSHLNPILDLVLARQPIGDRADDREVGARLAQLLAQQRLGLAVEH
jgi:hypothetical protein